LFDNGIIKPDFFIIGAPRAGTSWLWKMLKLHPDTSLPLKKEPFFFGAADNYHKGMDWYYDKFKDLDSNKIIGEGSTAYFYDKAPYFFNSGDDLVFDESLLTIPELAIKELPNVKIFICLRDPVSRAISHFNLFLRQGRIPPFSGIEEMDKLKPKLRLTDYGHYPRFLKLWREHVPPERIKLFIFEEDIKQSADKTIRSAYDFIGLDKNFKPAQSRNKVNQSWGWTRVVMNYYFGKKVNNLTEKKQLKWFFNTLDKYDVLKKINAKPSDIDYLRSIFLPEKEELEDLLDRKLDCWRYGR